MSDETKLPSSSDPPANPTQVSRAPQARCSARTRKWLIATGVIIVALAAGSVLFVSVGGKGEWTEQTFPDGNFKVKFPGKAKYEKGKSGDHSYGAGNGMGDMFIVYWSDSPAQDPAVVTSYADLARNEWTGGGGGPGLIVGDSRTPITLDGHPGLEQRLELQSGVCFRERFFLVGNTVYRLQMTTDKKKGMDSKDAEAFFASFGILQPVTPVGTATAKEERLIKSNDPPKHLPEEIVTAWREAGAEVGWMRLNEQGQLAFFSDLGQVPAFKLFGARGEGALARAPDPGTAFGLCFDPSFPVTDARLKGLARLTSLQLLDLDGALVTNVGLTELAGLKGLQLLNLHRTAVSDAGLKTLAELTNLRSLDLSNTQVTDAGLKELFGMKNLRTLDLAGAQIGPGVAELQKALPMCSIHR